ncbi:MAG TPA: hypothetical protein VN688_14615 [Gemmataceae bacterium]|nr:hypothetical protein [Gemmataceae bacterium]
MTLFWLLCVCLLLVGLAVCPQVRAALEDLWLHWFGVRQPVPRSSERPIPVPPRSPPHDRLPPFRVITRAGPR